MTRPPQVGLALAPHAIGARRYLYLLLLMISLSALAGAVILAPGADAAGPVFPTYVYVTVSGPASYDVMRVAAGKESRLSRVGVAGVGFSEVAARSAGDGTRTAVRVSGDRTGGSSLRIIDHKTSKALTVTLSRNDSVGIGTFAWSPDSKTLAYTVAAPQRDDADTGAGVLWLVGANGKGARKINAPGKTRLLGWSHDGNGLYYLRIPDDKDAAPDLWLQPLSGAAKPVLRSEAAGPQFSLFAVGSAPPVSTTIAVSSTNAVTPAVTMPRIAAVGAGNLAALTTPPVTGPPVPGTRAPLRQATGEAPAILAGDGAALYNTLRETGEAYTVLAWNRRGTHLLFSGGPTKTAWYADATTGQRWKLPTAVNGLAPLVWSEDGRYVVLANAVGPATSLVTLDTANGTITKSRKVGTAPTADKPAKDLEVPYVSQLWHTGSAFNGNWACGPTTVAMVLAYYGRLDPWPFAAGQARTSQQDRLRAAGVEPGKPNLLDGRLYGQYVTTPFTYKGRIFNASGLDPSGRKAQGLYGTIVGNTALAHWDRMIDVLGLYDLNADYVPLTWNAITAQLDKGYPVILGTTLTESGHILVARGYTANGYLLVNDPYGNAYAPHGYGANDGGLIAYSWKKLPLKMALTVRGTIKPPATPTPVPGTPPALTPGTIPSAAPTALPTPVGRRSP